MSGWMDEVLHGVRKRDDTAGGTELRNLQIEELSGVDDPANGMPGWLLTKSAADLKQLSDDELDSRIVDHEDALSEHYTDELFDKLQALLNERERRQQKQPVAKSEWPLPEEPRFPGLANMTEDELRRLRQWIEESPEEVEKAYLRQPKGWGNKLLAGQKIVFPD